MATYDELLDELSRLCGIVPEYWDIFGSKHMTSSEAKRSILKAMGHKTGSEEELASEIEKKRWDSWKRMTAPVHVISVEDQPFTLEVHIPAPEGTERQLVLSWSVENEDGRKETWIVPGERLRITGAEYIDGMRYVRAELEDARTRPIGYYTINVNLSGTARSGAFQ
jgi:hypothetical protein